MLNIRINNFMQNPMENNYISIDIENSTFAGLYGSKKRSFISLLSGLESFDGDIVLDTISLKGDHDEYIEQIAVMTKESVINTSLTVNDYLDFYGSMSNAINDEYEDRKCQLLEELGLQLHTNTQVAFLKEKDRAKVKLLSMFLKDRTLILLDTFLEFFQKGEQIVIIAFLKKYAKKERIILIGSDDYQLLQSFSEKIYILN